MKNQCWAASTWNWIVNAAVSSRAETGIQLNDRCHLCRLHSYRSIKCCAYFSCVLLSSSERNVISYHHSITGCTSSILAPKERQKSPEYWIIEIDHKWTQVPGDSQKWFKWVSRATWDKDLWLLVPYLIVSTAESRRNTEQTSNVSFSLSLSTHLLILVAREWNHVGVFEPSNKTKRLSQ